MSAASFSARLLAWFDQEGRKHLPWQTPPEPYRIWVSEIMLQQTQVAAVIPYFQRFLQRFPDIATLARADLDEVLHLWTGLGYYARARNLYKAAKIILDRHAGRFPTDFNAVCELPGIGRSTAGAILAFAYNQRHVILDGNVKRVLTRYHAVGGWPGKREVENRLWELAESHTPYTRIADYTQAIMDLGATVCRRAPECGRCPVNDSCRAYQQGNAPAYPTPAARKILPVKPVAMLMIHNADGDVFLQQRPPSGIWGGLWGFPECAVDADTAEWCRQALGLKIAPQTPWPLLRHTFSHFHLHITPIPAKCLGADNRVMENSAAVWYKPYAPDARGLAAPVKRLLEQLRKAS